MVEASRHRPLRLFCRADKWPRFTGVPMPCDRSGGVRSGVAASATGPRGRGSQGWPVTGSHKPKSFIHGQTSALPSGTRGRSRVPEFGALGSVRGAFSNGRPYRDQREAPAEGGSGLSGRDQRLRKRQGQWLYLGPHLVDAAYLGGDRLDHPAQPGMCGRMMLAVVP